VVRPAATLLAPSALADPSLLSRQPISADTALVRTSTTIRTIANENLLAWLTAQDERRERRLAEVDSASVDGPESIRAEAFNSRAADMVFDALGEPDFGI
jgi:hypothetical protein